MKMKVEMNKIFMSLYFAQKSPISILLAEKLNPLIWFIFCTNLAHFCIPLDIFLHFKTKNTNEKIENKINFVT